MVDSPTPVAVTNVVETKPAIDATAPATIEKVTSTTQTVTSKGDSVPVKPSLPTYDDKVRKWLALYVFTGFMGFITLVTIRPALLPGDTLGIILGGLMTLNGVVIGYYYQSSSGSTAKQAAQEKKEAL